MGITNEKQTPKRSFKKSIKRSLIIFIGNVIGIYLISFLGLGVEFSYFDDILSLVVFISLIIHQVWKNYLIVDYSQQMHLASQC